MNLLFGNFTLEAILLFSSCLLVLAVLASRISSTFGVPALLIFMCLGMLAGSEGPGGVPFENYKLAFAIGSVCLAIILFDGGLRTSWKSVRPILKVGVSLSFVGTVVTGIITGLFAHYILDLSWTEGMLLGAIVSSTDAAAVFSILRSKGLGVKGDLKQTLEFEAGSNDPVAVFMTLAVITYASMDQGGNGLASVAIMFVKQAGIGLLFGWYGARGLRWLINKSGVEFEGLYGVLVVGLALTLFALTSFVGGSGFLAAYVAGVALSDSEFLHKNSIVRFLDGIAWVTQIGIFLVLGLLVFPSKLLEVWKEGLLIGFFMMLVARPIGVLIAAPGKMLKKRERLFISWIGLRGAAPVILATLPWSMELPSADYLFNLVFFIVLVSVIFQGISIPSVAKFLKVTEPIKTEIQEERAGLLPPGFILVEIIVEEQSPACSRRIVDLGMPAGVLLTSLERDGRFLVPRGDTVLEAHDKVWGFARESNLEILQGMFGKVRRTR